MALEREARTNIMGSSLDIRNRNWDKVSAHLAEDVTKADVIQTTEVNSSTKIPSSVVTYNLQQQITTNSIKFSRKAYSSVNLNANKTFLLGTLTLDPVLANSTILGYVTDYISRTGGHGFLYSTAIIDKKLYITVNTADKYEIHGYVLYV